MDAPRQDGAPDLSAALNTLLSDPQLMNKISGIVNGTSAPPPENGTAPPSADDADTVTVAANAVPPPGNTAPGGLGGLLSNPDVMAKLPQVMATIAPLLGGEGKGELKTHSSPRHEDKRTALLCALKPYLSPRRCQAIDYIIKLEKIGSLLHTIK